MTFLVPAFADVRTGVDEEARLPYWELVETGVSIRWIQRLPDQTRGFFQGRGFTAEDSELIARQCVFQTVFKNVSSPAKPAVIEYDLREWKAHAAGARHGLRTREDWRRVWSSRPAVSPPARLAFEWALLPTHQAYRVGDYNWGMTLFGLDFGTEFDLDVVWRVDGERRTATVRGMRCARDLKIKPGEL